MTNIKTMMEELAQEELERDGAACREVMQSRKGVGGDLISRKALIAEYDRVHVGSPGGARKLMVDAPAVDAVPVVHGRWIPTYHTYYNRDGECQIADEWRCSECKVSVEGMWNYCPNCGTRMVGDWNE